MNKCAAEDIFQSNYCKQTHPPIKNAGVVAVKNWAFLCTSTPCSFFTGNVTHTHTFHGGKLHCFSWVGNREQMSEGAWLAHRSQQQQERNSSLNQKGHSVLHCCCCCFDGNDKGRSLTPNIICIGIYVVGYTLKPLTNSQSRTIVWILVIFSAI